MEPIYATEVREIGPEVAEFLEEGYLILFQTGSPAELAEMAVLHEVDHMRPEPPEPGDGPPSPATSQRICQRPPSAS